MLVLSFFSWWYGRGWKGVLTSIGPRVNNVMTSFSVNQLLKTLFEPWKRIVTYPGSSFMEKLRAWGDNTFSRVIGFCVRFGVLIAALFSIVAITIATIIEAVLWPLLPIAVPLSLLIGLFK